MRGGRAQGGFAYLWVMLLVVVIGVSLGATASLYQVSMQRDRERELLFIGHQFRDAIRRYYDATPGQVKQYPPSLAALLRDDRVPFTRRFLRQTYVDPMTGKAEWGLVRDNGRIVGVHSLSERQPIKIGNFDADDAGFIDRRRYADWQFTFPPGFDPTKPVETPPDRKKPHMR